jgi:hypothetical protein
MDDGEVLQGLNETWTFMGANMLEWCSGFMAFVIVSIFFASPARGMPYMLVACVGTTASLASLRMTFPDEERGMRNALAVSIGLPPPGIPRPARLQPIWSGCPVRELPETAQFMKLGLTEIFPTFERDKTGADENNG